MEMGMWDGNGYVGWKWVCGMEMGMKKGEFALSFSFSQDV
jgi:hypothetical protein